ncbi:histone-like nucleoid-structuring protein MvaT [Pseudomonas sp. TSRC2-2]|uniref:histone-like nucleoid-structuring protein MvaT n=1 Tax=unclassified Pseudomonas TaxID=196821 RepID=UPI003CEEFC3D
MSLINEYRATEEAIKELQGRLESLKTNDGLQKEIEFETKLKTLMGEYSKSLRDVIALLDPKAVTKGAAPTTKSGNLRAARKVKQYKNPHNGEVIEIKGGNHKGLKEWKKTYGSDTVECWVSKYPPPNVTLHRHDVTMT